MSLRLFLSFIILFSGISLAGQKKFHAKKVAIIFDTDMGPDYDDVGAITVLHTLADSGQATILATVASTRYEGVAGVLSVLNTYFNRPHIPIGVPKGDGLMLHDWQHWTDTLLVKYPHTISSNDEVPDAVEVYRKILVSQPDSSVTVVTVGFFTNLAHLLQSLPDKYSSLNGEALIKKKVKVLVSMAGKFPGGYEFNVMKDAPASEWVVEHWPTKILFSGFEIGVRIKTGLPLIHNNGIRNSPVKEVFSICIPKAREDSLGRSSWDETAVLVAIKGYAPWYTLSEGKMKVAADGRNDWDSQGKGQYYLIENNSTEIVRDIINNLLMHPPTNHH